MISLAGLFDTYGRNAWLRPALIISLPILSLAAVLISTLPSWWTTMASLIGASGVAYLAADIVQSRGKAREASLWTSWGGAPTTQRLRFTGNSNPAQVRRFHTLLTQAIPGIAVPSESDEASDLGAADQEYGTATRALIERTRDHKKHPLVFMQNYRYGFRRNLWGSRRLGISACVLSLLVLAASAALNIWFQQRISWTAISFVAALDLVLLVALIRAVTEGWVRQAADAYADQLLGALERL